MGIFEKDGKWYIDYYVDRVRKRECVGTYEQAKIAYRQVKKQARPEKEPGLSINPVVKRPSKSTFKTISQHVINDFDVEHSNKKAYREKLEACRELLKKEIKKSQRLDQKLRHIDRVFLVTLVHVKKAYSENLQSILKCRLGSDKHKRLLRVERELNSQEEKMLRVLSKHVPDPCPLSHPKDCQNCTGFYKREHKHITVANGTEQYVYKCIFKTGGVV